MSQHDSFCLIIDADPDHGESLVSLCAAQGFRTKLLGSPADMDREHAQFVDVAFIDTASGMETLQELADGCLADAELFAMAEADDAAAADACIRMGYSLFFIKPFRGHDLEALLADIAAESTSVPVDQDRDVDETAMSQFGLMRGSSRSMRKMFRLLRKVGPTDTSTLIVGESGAGKELVAETLHQLSTRSAAPYLTVNCAAISENLIESELFGHEKGSFSGAQRMHRGFFESANGGTLFLDEITEMSIDVQAKLLRVLESGEVRRVGAVDAMQVDVRIVAATNRNPQEAVEDGVLREDLYYRLAHVTVQVPPLRRRGGDRGGLARFFLRQLNEKHQTGILFTEPALKKIDEYHWPGNVRQLRHAVERAYILSEDHIDTDALALDEPEGDRAPAADIPIPYAMPLHECERRIILANLENNQGNKQATADMLGISLKTLYNRLNDYEESEG